METNKIIQGDCLEVLKTLPENSIDSIVCDPPYELGFMGKSWDNTGIAYNKEMWAECLRVLKPGGHLLAFSGTRTYHRMAVAIEDAGFEVRDMIEWVYGSGFPKSLNIGKAVDKLQGNEREVVGEKRTPDGKTWSERRPNGDITGYTGNGTEQKENTQGIETKGTSEWEGWGTALKPAHEPICMARKPLAEKTVAENCLKWGTGGINIDESRVGFDKDNESFGKEVNDYGEKAGGQWQQGKQIRSVPPEQGRFPANLIHDNSEEVRECFPETNGGKARTGKKGGSGFGFFDDEKTRNTEGTWHGGSGNASRFFKSIPIEEQDEIQEECTSMEEKLEALEKGQVELLPNGLPNCNHNPNNTRNDIAYCARCYEEKRQYYKSIIYQAKASKSERNKGCEGLEVQSNMRVNAPRGNEEEKTANKMGNHHPTIKPIALMEYLIKMVTPKGGIVLDPFAGSGSTLVAAKQNGFQYIGIELTEEYIPIIEARLSSVIQQILL